MHSVCGLPGYRLKQLHIYYGPKFSGCFEAGQDVWGLAIWSWN